MEFVLSPDNIFHPVPTMSQNQIDQQDKDEFISHQLLYDDVLIASEYSAAAGFLPCVSPTRLLNKKLSPQNQQSREQLFDKDFINFQQRELAIIKLHVYKHLLDKGCKNIHFEDFSRIVSKHYPWLAYGFDYFAHYEINGEQKTVLVVHSLVSHDTQYNESLPQWKKDRIHGTMALMKLDNIEVTQTIFARKFTKAGRTFISWHTFDEEYWNNKLFPAMRNWYMNKYLPKRILQHRDSLLAADTV
jgi:hypothetical protein